MKRVIWITILAVVAFAMIIIARLPASWVVPSPPAKIACAGTDGSIWNGTCSGLTVQGKAFGDVTWELHASRLLSGKVAARITVTGPAGAAQGDLESNFSGKDITAQHLTAEFPLDPSLIPQLPPTLHGSAHAELTSARVQNGVITELQGHVEGRDLGNAQGAFGSYAVTFPGGPGEPTGQLHDLGGPLAVEGTLRLTREPGFDLQGLVTARPTAPPDLAKDIQFLGSPDAQGRRPFALAATF